MTTDQSNHNIVVVVESYPVLLAFWNHATFLMQKNPENPDKENQLQVSKYLRN